MQKESARNDTATNTRVPFLDLRSTYTELKSEILQSVSSVLDSGHYILGPQCSSFEAEFSKYCGVQCCSGISNGLEAIHLLLRALNIKPGDEVIVPSNTFIATWLAASYVGATLVPVEPKASTYNLDPNLLEAAITKKTRAIIAVHLYGQCAEMTAINQIAAQYDIAVIEDAAQAQGATFNEKKAGNLGLAAAFSFYPGKNLGAFGDAGAVTTNNEDLLRKLNTLRNYGSEKKYVHSEIGFNARLDEMQAAILRVKLTKLDEWNERRKQIAARYLDELSSNEALTLPVVAAGVKPVWHLFVVRVKNREKFQRHLDNKGVSTLIHYPTPPHWQRAYKNSLNVRGEHFPISEMIHNEVVSLPIGPHMSESQVSQVIEAAKGYND